MRCANPTFLLFPCTVCVNMSYSLISTCRIRYKLKLFIRIQILCKSGPVVLRLKMHGNSPKPNSPFSAHSGRSLQICNQWGCQRKPLENCAQTFPCLLFYGQGAFQKTDRLLGDSEKAEISWDLPRQIQPSALHRAEGVAFSQPKLKV